MEDGSSKQYNLEDIEDFSFIDNSKLYVMKIHYEGEKVAYYPIEIIGKVMFELDGNANRMMNVYISGFPKPYLLGSIDSVVFIIDKYQPLTIGEQVWMLKNLNVDTYRNGDSIKHIVDFEMWKEAERRGEAWCYYDNDSANGEIYGKLYNAYAVHNSKGLAPEGWHVPSEKEWGDLEHCVGNDAGFKLKSKDYWRSPNTGATNEYGFSALPGGNRYDYQFEDFLWIGNGGFWWTSTRMYDQGWLMQETRVIWIYNIQNFLGGAFQNNVKGFSVRCIKDK